MQRIIPYLLYEDVAGTMQWLARAFGYRAHGPKNRKPDGTVFHAAMQLDDGLVMMGWPGPKYKNPKHARHVSFNMYVMVDDVERHYQRAKKAGAKIIEELATTPFGARRYGAEDPEGHQWYFAEHAAKPKRARKRAPR
jgi:PhnB protein